MGKGRRNKDRKTVWKKLEIDYEPSPVKGCGCYPIRRTRSDSSAPNAAAGNDCCDNNKQTSTKTLATYNEDICYDENDEPQQRRKHMAVRLEHYVVMFGGTGYPSEDAFLPCHVIWFYNLYTEMWTKHVMPDKAKAPRPCNFASAVEINNAIYMFGGKTSENKVNGLWKLKRKKWRLCMEENNSKKGSFTSL